MHVIYDPAAQGGSALSPEDDGSAAAAAAAAAQDDSAAGTAETDAFSAGVEEARQREATEDGQPAAPGAGDGQPPPADGAAGADAAAAAAAAAAPGEGEGKGKDGKDGKPADPPAGGEPTAVDKEIQELGITNERTKSRFRELSERAAEAETLRPLAQRGQEWEETIQSTGANPEQMGQALNYLAAVNSGDPAALRQAHQFLTQEVEWLSKQLGLPVPGYDPLTEFPDLAEQVSNGDTTRELAQEVAANRRAQALQTQRQEQSRQRSSQEQQATAAVQQGVAQVAELGKQLRATDPSFAAKFKTIEPLVRQVQATLPPDQWAAAVKDLYEAAPSPVTPPPPPTPNPARPTGVSLVPTAADDPFGFGVEEARARGM